MSAETATTISVHTLFTEAGGTILKDYPVINVPAFHTPQGTPYLTQPGVALLAKPSVAPVSLQGFLDGFSDSLHFSSYTTDPVMLDAGAALCKVAGQTCYMSFGEKRTMNAEAEQYFENITSSKHGSVLEHANYSFLCYGISRSVTHELVRHRAGFAFSQVSQRYVSGKVLRFVERPEYQENEALHTLFIGRIERAAQDYAIIAKKLLAMQEAGDAIVQGEAKTDLRKKVQQAARSVLPNETEAPLVVTANVRAWRHFIEMRASAHAEVEIRLLALRIFLCLREAEPILFNDYTIDQASDGLYTVSTKHEKV